MCFLQRLPVESCPQPKVLTHNEVIVPLPEPGGPINKYTVFNLLSLNAHPLPSCAQKSESPHNGVQSSMILFVPQYQVQHQQQSITMYRR